MCNWANTDDIGTLLHELGIVEDETRRMLERIEIMNGNTRRGYIYAATNAAVQLTLGAISIGINAAVSKRSNNDIWGDPLHIINMFVVPTLVFSQYLVHSVLIARPLRKMDDQSTELTNELEKLKNSVRAKVLKLNKLASEIDRYSLELHTLNVSIENDNEQLVANDRRIQQINSQPIPVEEEERIREELIGLLKEQETLEQKVISSMKNKRLLADTLQTLVRDTDKLIMELRINFAQYEKVDDIDRHIQEMKPQLELDQEINGDPPSLASGV